MVARGGRKKVLEDDVDDSDAPALELDKDSVIEPNLDEPDVDTKSEVSNDHQGDLAEQFADEKTKSSPLRTVLMASVAVAIISISGYLLKGPVNALIGNSPTNTASQNSNSNGASKPVADNKAVQPEAAKPAVEAKSNASNATPAPEVSIDLNATSLPPSTVDTEAVDGAQIVDPSTTQSIGRQLAFNEASPQSGVIRCLLYTSPSPRDLSTSRMPSSA